MADDTSTDPSTHRSDERRVSGATAGRPRDGPSSIAVVLAITRAEWVHRQSYARTHQRGIGLLLAGAFVPLFGGLLWGTYVFGGRVGAGEAATVLDVLRWAIVSVVGLYVFVGIHHSGTGLLGFSARPLLLTAVPERLLVLSLLVADVRKHAPMIAIAAIVGVVFAVGTGSVVLAVVAPAASTLLLTAAICWGYVLGLSGRFLLRRLRVSERVRTLLEGLGSVALVLAFGAGGAIVGGLATQTGLYRDTSSLSAVVDAPPPLPIGYYADVFFVGTPLLGELSPVALASVAAVLVSLPLCVGILLVVTPPLWYHDPRQPPEPDGDGARGAEGWGDRPRRSARSITDRRDWPWLRTPAGFVADGLLRRTVRRPQHLLHATYYLFPLAVITASVAITQPSLLPALLGGSLVLLGIWLAGGVFGLDPLGAEGTMPGQLVLSQVSAASFVRARVLAGLAVGSPPILGGTAVLAVGPLTAGESLLLGGYWLLVALVGAYVAVGIGSLLPQTEPGSVLQDAGPNPPATEAKLAHGGLTTALALAGPALVTVDLTRPQLLAGVAVLAAFGILLRDCSNRFATRRLREYGRPRSRDPIFALELAAVLVVLGFSLSVLVPASLPAFLIVSERLLPTILLGASAVGWLLVGYVYRKSVDDPPTLGRRLPAWNHLGYLAGGVLATAAVVTAGAMIATQWNRQVPSPAVSALASGEGDAVAASLVLVAVFLAPAIEYLFRGVVQNRLVESVPTRWAITWVALLFTLAQLPMYTFAGLAPLLVLAVAVFGLALLWGWLYARTSALVVPILCHGAYAATAYGTALFAL